MENETKEQKEKRLQKERARRYRQSEKYKQTSKKWREENKEKIAIKKTLDRIENKEIYKEKDKNYYNSKKDIIKEKRKEYYKNKKHLWKNNSYIKKYGISLEEYEKLLKEQNNSCKICQVSVEGLQNKRYKCLVVDHCHATGKIRGLLCNTCNRGIGLLKENVEILQNAIMYLEQKKAVDTHAAL